MAANPHNHVTIRNDVRLIIIIIIIIMMVVSLVFAMLSVRLFLSFSLSFSLVVVFVVVLVMLVVVVVVLHTACCDDCGAFSPQMVVVTFFPLVTGSSVETVFAPAENNLFSD